MMVDMDTLEARCLELIAENRDVDSMHWVICDRLCAEYDLGDCFPMWLMHVVSGSMREMGVYTGN